MDEKMTRRDASKIILAGTASSFLNFCTTPSFNKETMNKRLIPSSGELLPVIGLGTWQTFDVGQSTSELDPLREVLKTLVENGGSLIDSSPMYGRSEKVVGQLTSELGIKEKIFEATKVWTSGQKEGEQQINDSFRLLQADPIELFQIHNLVDWPTQLQTLRRLKDNNKIKYIGLTHYHSGGYDNMEELMRTEQIDFIQINYNLAVRAAAERILPLAKDKGIAVLINRPYEGGTLFRKTKKLQLPEWASEFEADSWGQFFLKFILSNDAVTCVIPGTAKPHHMLDNVQAGYGMLPDKTQQAKMVKLLKSI